MKKGVTFVECTPDYPQQGPFSPDEFFPEYPFSKDTISSEPNDVYRCIRDSFRLLELDNEHFGTPEWNPLKEIVKPGDTVIIKPNWVYHQLSTDPKPEEVLITHPSIIRAVLDYVIKACLPGGKIIIGDAPIQSAIFQEILNISQIDSIIHFFSTEKNINIHVEDFRSVIATITKGGQIHQGNQYKDNFLKFREVNLGELSYFSGIGHLSSLFRVMDYKPSTVIENHHNKNHKYLISSSVLEANVIINLPKLKSHRLCGMTCSLKNLVGINADKAYLPHFRLGTPDSYGDEYPNKSIIKKMRSLVRTKYQFSENKRLWILLKFIGKILLRIYATLNRGKTIAGVNEAEILSGGWYGNDTAWRMVLDLNLILLFADSNGIIHNIPQRKYMSIIDAIISGEGFGPLEPKRKRTGAIISGFSPVATDVVATKIMGFDNNKIPMIKNAINHLGVHFPHERDNDLYVITKEGYMNLNDLEVNWHFEPPKGWVGHIESNQ